MSRYMIRTLLLAALDSPQPWHDLLSDTICTLHCRSSTLTNRANPSERIFVSTSQAMRNPEPPNLPLKPNIVHYPLWAIVSPHVNENFESDFRQSPYSLTDSPAGRMRPKKSRESLSTSKGVRDL